MIVKRSIMFMGMVAAILLSARPTQCDQTDKAVDTPTAFLRVDEHETHAFHGDTKLHIWTLQGHHVSELTIRLLHIAGGQSRQVDETALTWNAATTSRVTGKVLFLVQDGQAFAEKGKFSPSLSVVFDDIPPQNRRVTTSSLLLEKPPADIAVQNFKDGKIGVIQTRTSFLYRSTFLRPGQNKSSVENDLSALIEESRKGVTFVVVTLDWKPA